MEKILWEEIAEGSFIITSTSPGIVSALRSIPKACGDELWLIRDCSMPVGHGVNSCVPSLDKLYFQTIDDAFKLVNKEFYLAKIILLSCMMRVFALGKGGHLAYSIA